MKLDITLRSLAGTGSPALIRQIAGAVADRPTEIPNVRDRRVDTLVLEWATLPPDRHASWALRLCDVRGFARHLLNVEPRTEPRAEVPPVKSLPPLRRAKPYLYPDGQTRKLLAAALELPPTAGLRRRTFHCLFGLSSVTGLRVGEARRISRVTAQRATLRPLRRRDVAFQP